MAAVDQDSRPPSPENRQLVETWLAEFNRSWNERRLAIRLQEFAAALTEYLTTNALTSEPEPAPSPEAGAASAPPDPADVLTEHCVNPAPPVEEPVRQLERRPGLS